MNTTKPSRGSFLATLAVLGCAALPAGAQLPMPLGGTQTYDCTSPAHIHPETTNPLLLVFEWPTVAREDASPDVVFDESWWGGLGGWGPDLGGVTVGPGWYADPNFRMPETMRSLIDVVILSRGEIWLDSKPLFPTGQEFDGIRQQALGALIGGAPEVLTLSNRHEIRWRALIEVDDTDLDPGSSFHCSAAGAGPPGFIVGYAVWALPAAIYPVPTPDDFLRHGTKYFADTRNLDFAVPDVDGLGGSDLDPSDGLVLINPDGLPDTGDEILDMEICPRGGLAQWYAVQPIVRGRFDYYDGGTSQHGGVAPGVLVDLTSDGVPDVADILADGLYEFSDGCGAGLGLLWQGGIATSASPGLGTDLAFDPGCVPASSCDRGIRGFGMTVYEPSAVDLRSVEPLSVRPSPGGMLVVGWEESLGDGNHLYAGDLNLLVRGRMYTHAIVLPCTRPGPPAVIPMPANDTYFLVTQWSGGVESSYGRDSTGRERPPVIDPCP